MITYKIIVEFSRKAEEGKAVLARAVFTNIRVFSISENYIRIIKEKKLEIKKIKFDRIWSIHIEREIGGK